MIVLLRFFEICLFKASPADLPASSWLMKLSLLGYFLVSVMVNSFEFGPFISLLGSLVELVVLIIAIHFLLQLTGYSGRYQQTLTAMAGTGICIGIIAIPVIVLFHYFAGGEDVRITVLAVWLAVLLMVWSIAVTAYIFKQAMELKPGLAVIATIAYTVVLVSAVRLTIAGVA